MAEELGLSYRGPCVGLKNIGNVTKFEKCVPNDLFSDPRVVWLNHHCWVLFWGNRRNALKVTSTAADTGQQKRFDPASHASLQASQITVWKLNELSVDVLPHPPYSSDFSPPEYYHLLKHFKNFLTGRTVDTQDQTQNAFWKLHLYIFTWLSK